MKHWYEVIVVLAVLLLIPVGFAEAGFVGTVNVGLADEWPPGPPPWVTGPPEHVFSKIPGEAAQGLLTITELFGGPEALALDVSGETDEDPILNIVKEINNDSGFTWVGFELTLPDGGSNTFTGTPTCDAFTLTSQTSYEVVFGTPSPLPHSQTMVLDFDVLIPSTGPFSFTLTQTPVPIPEPSTLVLLIIGSLWLLFCIRKR